MALLSSSPLPFLARHAARSGGTANSIETGLGESGIRPNSFVHQLHPTTLKVIKTIPCLLSFTHPHSRDHSLTQRATFHLARCTAQGKLFFLCIQAIVSQLVIITYLKDGPLTHGPVTLPVQGI